MKLIAFVFFCAAVSLFVALITHPGLGGPGCIWMVVPTMIYIPYSLLVVIHELTGIGELKDV